MTQLRLQLRDAAEQENRRGPVRRSARSVLSRGSAPAMVVAICVAAAAALAAVVLPIERADDPAPAGSALRIVADQPLVARGGALALAGGAVWASDPGTGEILRLDPETRDVLTRLPASSEPGGDTALSAGPGGLWAASGEHLLRFDAARGDVTARLRLPEPGVGFPIGTARHTWLVDALKLRRVDPARMAFDREARLDHGGVMARAVATDGETIYVQRGDGTVRGYDATTGGRVAGVRAERPEYLEQATGGALVLSADDRVELVDARTNTTRWLRPLGTSAVNGAVVQGSAVWVHGSDERTGRDRLWRLDLRDGRILGSVALPQFGVSAMQPVGDELWLVADGGRLTVVTSS